MPSGLIAGGGREQDDGQSVIAAGAGVPPVGHYLSTGQLLQQQADTPSVCEGEVSQVLPPCFCQTVQPALLPIDLTLYSALCNNSVTNSFYHPYLLYIFKTVYKKMTAHSCISCKDVYTSIQFYFLSF